MRGLTVFGAECDAMIPHHVEVHAFGIHRVAAELTRHSAVRFSNRLFQQGFAPRLPFMSDDMPGLPAFRQFATQ